MKAKVALVRTRPETIMADYRRVMELAGYREQATINGAGDLSWISADELKTLEPNVVGVAALFSPTTGIIDSHSYMLSLQGRLEARGGMIAFGNRVIALEEKKGRPRLRIDGDVLDCQVLIVPHHGSRGSCTPVLLEAASPSIALVPAAAAEMPKTSV